jgi:hypothetical protein
VLKGRIMEKGGEERQIIIILDEIMRVRKCEALMGDLPSDREGK